MKSARRLARAEEFKRALELNPNHAPAHNSYGFFLVIRERFDEGIAEVDKGRDLDPLSSKLCSMWRRATTLPGAMIRLSIARRRRFEVAPDFWLLYLIAGRAHEQKREWSAAIAEYQKALAIEKQAPEALMDLGRANGLSGRRSEAERILRELKSQTRTAYVSPFHIAMVHIGLGDKEQAFAALEQAYEARTWYMTWLKVAPEFDSLRSDPRFADLVRRVGLQ